MPYGNGPVENMQYLQQMEAQQQPPAPRNAIAEGAKTGIEAAKRSLEMNEREERRALGMALLAFNSQPLQYGDQNRSPLAGINQGFLPAVQAYNQERDNAMNLNYKLMDNLQKQKQFEDELAYKNKNLADTIKERESYHKDLLAERKLHHQMQYGNTEELLEEEKRVKEKYGPGFELFDKYPPNSRLRLVKDQDVEKWGEKANTAAIGLHSIAKMREIFNRNPKLWGTVDIALLKKHELNPTLLNTMARNAGVSEKDLADFQELATYSKELLVANSNSVSAKGLNMFMEKRMNAAIPDLGTVPAAAAKMLDSLEQPHAFNYDVGTKKVEYAKEGLYWRTPVKGSHKITKKYQEGEAVDIPEQSNSPEIPASSGNEAVQAIRAQYPGTEKFSDQQIMEWAQSRGLL